MFIQVASGHSGNLESSLPVPRWPVTQEYTTSKWTHMRTFRSEDCLAGCPDQPSKSLKSTLRRSRNIQIHLRPTSRNIETSKEVQRLRAGAADWRREMPSAVDGWCLREATAPAVSGERPRK